MLSVSAAALVCRFLVALVAPLWIVRSATGLMQRRASITSVAVLLSIQAGLNLGMVFVNGWNNEQLTQMMIS